MARTVIVTGASRGLGLALAGAFLREGDRVIAVSKTKKNWKTARKFLPQGDVQFFSVDLTSWKQVELFSKKILKKYSPIDILINNAGVGGRLARVEEATPRQYQNLMDGNLRPAFLLSKAFIPQFKKQKRGVVVNISSMAGTRAVPQLFAYSASKFGILALSQCIAKENQESIKCYTICPGGMDTRMRESLFGKEDSKKQQSPQFVAEVILKTISGDIEVESGGDITIRHGKITAIRPCPGA